MVFLNKKDKKSLIGSIRYQQTIMIHTKRVIFMVLPLLFVPLVYGLSSTPDACAAPEAGWRSSQDCTVTSFGGVLCCWKENGVEYCQTCIRIPYGTPGTEEGGWECTTKEKSLEQPPTPQPFDPTAPLQGGVLEQLPDQPPLFGRNEAAVPPTGGIEQPFTTTTPPLFGNIPQGGGFGILQEPETPPTFGQAVPEGHTLAGEGENIQPMNTTFPTPQPFPPPTPGFKAPQTSIDISPDLAPEDDQDETDDGRNDIIPDTGITEQPETQQPEEEPSYEGQDTAGPLT
jgi:hypothetical protein